MGAVRFSCGLALELSPCARIAQNSDPLPRARTWSHPTSGRDAQFAAATIERWYYAARRGHDDPWEPCVVPCGKTAQDLPGHALAERLMLQHTTTRTGAINSTTTTRRLGEGRACAGRLPSYARSNATCRLMAWCSCPGSGRRATWRGARGNQTPGTGDPQLRSHPRRSTLASRLPSRIAQGAHCRRQWLRRSRWASSTTTRGCAATSSGISRRPPRIWSRALSGDPETRFAACAVDRQRLGDGGRGSHRRALASGDRRRANAPYSPYQNGKQESFWGTLEDGS